MNFKREALAQKNCEYQGMYLHYGAIAASVWSCVCLCVGVYVHLRYDRRMDESSGLVDVS